MGFPNPTWLTNNASPINGRIRECVYNYRMAQGGSNKKVANGLVSASCAAVLAVYAAGYMRTQAASDNRFSTRVVERRPTSPDSTRVLLHIPASH